MHTENKIRNLCGREKLTPNVMVHDIKSHGNWLEGKLRLMSWRNQLKVSVHECPGHGFPFHERHGSAHRNAGSLRRAAGEGSGLPRHPATQDPVTASGLCVWRGHIVSEEGHGVNKPGSKVIPCALVTVPSTTHTLGGRMRDDVSSCRKQMRSEESGE